MNLKSHPPKVTHVFSMDHLIMKIVLMLFLALIMANCNEKSPSKPVDSSIEKDGVITIKFEETCWDTTDGRSHLLDSLNVSEETNVIDIPNAVPFELSSLSSVEFYFSGDFEGVQDTVFLWLDYVRDDPYKGRHRFTEIIRIPNGRTVITLLSYGSEPTSGNAKGYIFLLDTDNNNTGAGYVQFLDHSTNEKVWIDAAKNTVCYTTNAATVDFDITCMPFHPEGYDAENFRMYSLDYDSYKNMPDRAICVLSIKRDNATSIFAFSTFFAYGEHYLPCSIKAYGFVPHFK